MALINCLECGAQISSTAIKCPKCGAPNIIENKTTTIEEPLKPAEKRTKRKVIYIIAGCLIIIASAVFLILYNQNLSGEEEDSSNEQTEQNTIAKDETTINETENKTTTATANKKNQIEETKKKIRNTWYNYITVERSDYTYREAGGIYDLYIKVTNNTDYTLNSVETSISYIKTKGDIYKTETVSFTNIAPHTWVRLKAPDSNRGTSVDYLSISSVQSNDLNFCYTPGNWAANSADPYKCK